MTRHMAFIGSSRWATTLARISEKYGGEGWTYEAVPIPGSSLSEIFRAFCRADIAVRVGMAPGRSGRAPVAIDALWEAARLVSPSTTRAFYWIGGDVSLARERVRSGRKSWSMLRSRRDLHLAGAPWLCAELEEIEIAALVATFPVALPEMEEAPPLPERFAVLSYIPDHRHEYYGSSIVHGAAEKFPEIDFHIVAGSGDWGLPHLPNIRFVGWQQDMAEWYERAVVVARLVPHDAISAIVREAMTYARHVVYTYPLPGVITVERTGAAFEMELKRLADLHRTGRLELNHDGRVHALSDWEPAKLTRRMLALLIGRHEEASR